MTNTIRNVLHDLERVQESLLALSEEIWVSIDHNDQEALEEGFLFKKTYNAKVKEFDELSSVLQRLVREFTRMEEEEPEVIEEGKEVLDVDEGESRRIAQLDDEEPHSLDENFRHMRPQGFRLGEHRVSGTRTWRRLYASVLKLLSAIDPERYAKLGGLPAFQYDTGRVDYAKDAAQLRTPMAIPGGWFAESNLSANAIAKQLRALLEAFDLPLESFVVYLREDRDAEGEPTGTATDRGARSAFVPGCLDRLVDHLPTTLEPVRKVGNRYEMGPDRLTCSVSKYHEKQDTYWFSFGPIKRDWLLDAERGWCAFGCGSPDTLFSFPISEFQDFLPTFGTSHPENGKMYWHVKIRKTSGGWVFLTEGDHENIPIDTYLV